MAESLAWQVPDEGATRHLGEGLARALGQAALPQLVVYFEGELGAGKTALIRALLAGLGHRGRVPSPTYTLVEPYLLDTCRVLHADLYRLRSPAELDDLGLTDAPDPGDGRGNLLLVEWPSRGTGRLPGADLECHLPVPATGRHARFTARTEGGMKVLLTLGRTRPEAG